jgi:MFS family permease
MLIVADPAPCQICVLGYTIIATSLVVFVQAKNVYPQLLLGRLFFSLGGAAVSTMVTAVLPTMSFVAQENPNPESAPPSDAFEGNGHGPSPSISSELTITPARFQSHSEPPAAAQLQAGRSHQLLRSSSSQIAGYVGVFAGCGALLALLLFLPLPARFQQSGSPPDRALQYSYYIVAVVALVVAIVCYVGLRDLKGEGAKGWTSRHGVSKSSIKQLWEYFRTALTLGLTNSEISLGYIGGFVARASSVGISLFVPLLVNASFTSSGQCSKNGDVPGGLPDLKRRCPEAYILAAELTGVSQLVALICAPAFGYASAKVGTTITLMFAAAAGIVGYPTFATHFSPKGHQAISFFSVCLIGISQIGAIVCSLATLSNGVLDPPTMNKRLEMPQSHSNDDVQSPRVQSELYEPSPDEQTGLLPGTQTEQVLDLSEVKGSIAGVYSLYGGAGILLLTKLGGYLFDKVSFGAPFYIMAAFNGILMVVCVLISAFRRSWSNQRLKVNQA